MTIETREKDGVEEHRHEQDGYGYWHPADRVHGQTVYEQITNEGNRNYEQLLESLGNPTYVLHGSVELKVDYENGKLYPVGCSRTGYEPDFETIPFVCHDMLTVVTDHKKSVTNAIWEVKRFRNYYAEPFSSLIDATVSRLERDEISATDAIRCIKLAQQVCHMYNSDYDLVTLPSGGHVPVGILEEDYEVSTEILAQIPRGEDRDDETFACPICGTRSFFAGVCEVCHKNSDPKNTQCDEDRRRRKEQEHDEISQLVESGNWSQCHFIRG